MLEKGLYWLSIFCAAIGISLNFGPHPEFFFMPSIVLAGIATISFTISHIVAVVSNPEA